jgi:hypothetical protein
MVEARKRRNILSEIQIQFRRHILPNWRYLLAGAAILLTALAALHKSQESIESGGNLHTKTVVRKRHRKFGKARAQSQTNAEPTGADLHLSKCGMTWEKYYTQLPPANPDDSTTNRPFQWTISGGDEYRDNLGIILEKWKTLGIDPALVVALDKKSAKLACKMGFAAVHWDAPIASYSRVADSKFEVAASICDRGYRSFFIEMDVFCRKNPIPLFLKEDRDLVTIGHGDVAYAVNIGSFMASPKMGPFFRGLLKVLSYSLEHRQHTNQANWTVEFFDQSVYQHCLPPERQNEDDDADFFPFEYYLLNDTNREHDLLQHCRKFSNFTRTVLPHHIMSCHDPPTVYDSTYCIHPLASQPFTPFVYKLGVAKFYGWDPQPIDPDEKFLKLTAGDMESNNCWNRCFEHETRMNEFTFYDKVAMYISVLVEIAETTDRTLLLPQYIRDKDSWALPTHGIVNVRTLGVPYRVMPPHQSHDFGDDDTAVVYAAHNFSETLRRATDKKYDDVKVLSIMKICNVRDYKLEVLETRRKRMGWCFDKDQDGPELLVLG